MVTEEELAYIKSHLINLYPAVLRQLKTDITAEKRGSEEATAGKAPGSREGHKILGGGCQSNPNGEEFAPPQKTAGKHEANELHSSSSGGSMEPPATRPLPGPLSEAGSEPLHAEKEGAKVARVLGSAFTGEQAAKCSRQIRHAEAGAAYAGLVAGKMVKGSTARVNTLAMSPNKNGAPKEVKEGRDVKSLPKTPPRPNPPEGR
jgi:hypothetical protein